MEEIFHIQGFPYVNKMEEPMNLIINVIHISLTKRNYESKKKIISKEKPKSNTLQQSYWKDDIYNHLQIIIGR